MFGPHDRLVPQRRQDGRDGRLADFTALPSAVLGNDVVEGNKLCCLNKSKQLGARIREVFAYMTTYHSASDLHGGVEQVGDERQAATAAGTSLGGRLHLAYRSEGLGLDRRTDFAFGDVVAGANLGRVW